MSVSSNVSNKVSESPMKGPGMRASGSQGNLRKVGPRERSNSNSKAAPIPNQADVKPPALHKIQIQIK